MGRTGVETAEGKEERELYTLIHALTTGHQERQWHTQRATEEASNATQQRRQLPADYVLIRFSESRAVRRTDGWTDTRTGLEKRGAAEWRGGVASVPVLRASRGTLGQPCSDEKNYQK